MVGWLMERGVVILCRVVSVFRQNGEKYYSLEPICSIEDVLPEPAPQSPALVRESEEGSIWRLPNGAFTWTCRRCAAKSTWDDGHAAETYARNGLRVHFVRKHLKSWSTKGHAGDGRKDAP